MSSSYAPRSPDLSGVPESAASYYPPQDSFALANASSYHYGHKPEPSDLVAPAQYPQYPQPQPPFAHYPPQYPPPFAAAASAAPPLPMASHADDNDDKPYPGEQENVVVKTKFPVARIKRIVQADEEVGKVAQVTPVVVSKALELFMIALALSSAEQARARNSKRVTAAHLKLAVSKDDQFDFLSDIADKIADAPAAAKESKARRRSASLDAPDDLDDEAAAAPKKRSTRGRKPKKPATDDDDDW